MHYTEYDEHGVGVEQEIDLPLGGVSEEALAEARLELTTKWGASESGSKDNPDNAHGLFLIFWAHPLEPVTKRFTAVWEIGGFWRRGVGVRVRGRVLGLWAPWRRPPRPVLDTPERIDLSPAELLEAS